MLWNYKDELKEVTKDLSTGAKNDPDNLMWQSEKSSGTSIIEEQIKLIIKLNKK